MPLASRILLFDIDGTLLNAAGAGRRAMERAFADLYGAPDVLQGIDMFGASDGQIVRVMMQRHGVTETAAALAGFIDAFAVHLERTLAESHGAVLSGIVPLLETLAQRDVAVGLGTGNFRRTGYGKLRHYGLDGYFLDGGFGDDSAQRPDILAAAAERMRRYVLHGAPVVVIGDTVHDVTAGHSIDAKVVAVSNGFGREQDLRDAGADTILPDCMDLDAALAAILDSSP